MPRRVSSSDIRAALRKAQQEQNRQIKQAQAKLQRDVDQHNRKAERHNQKVIADYNRQVDAVNRHNQQAFGQLTARLHAAESRPTVHYTVEERQLADRVQEAILAQDPREYDVFLSYARIDGAEVAGELRERLETLGVAVWFDEIAMRPGKSQALQMDQGLRRAQAGIALLTPAYLAGRFWTERELGALLHKPTLIPVLHGVTFSDVAQYSGILPDLAGFETSRDSVAEIAEKIAGAVLSEVD
ncbi:toll/interleukin-1 receptor domain-containing protein [Nonomuraea sp. NPDC050643]|uniref:toll/interleukin-1 receptor domain-containing protein n=1 Tax=Nonomuraea sp. NPDC050643 TaxID=3155660 RepID=UPI0033FD0B84